MVRIAKISGQINYKLCKNWPEKWAVDKNFKHNLSVCFYCGKVIYSSLVVTLKENSVAFPLHKNSVLV